MRLKYLFVSLFVSFGLVGFPLTASAACSTERLAELNKIASNVDAKYSYEMVDNYPKFTVTLTNITSDIYVKDNVYLEPISGVSEKKLKYVDGINVVFTIYSNDTNCKNEILNAKYVNIPTFNEFSNTEECNMYPDFKYCDTWLDTLNITNDKFEVELNKYKEKTNKKNDEKQKDIQKNESLISKLGNNIYAIGIGVVILIAFIVIIIYRKKIKHKGGWYEI